MAKKKVAAKAAKKTAAKKTATKKSVVKKTAAKKTVAKKTAAKKVAEAVTETVKTPAKRATKKVAKAKVEEEELPEVVVKRRFVKPAKAAKLNDFQKRQKQKLLDLRDQITDSMHGIQNDTIKGGAEGADTSGSGMHQGDAGSDAYDRDFALGMLSKEANALGEIEEALQRLELGTYGICEESGEQIPEPRLDAMPFARLTVACQAAKEKSDSLSDHSTRDFGFN